MAWWSVQQTACLPARMGFGATPHSSGGSGGMRISLDRDWDRVPRSSIV
ncbi:hypothetical protein [Pseudobacteroides cellulosolvens]|nr:hypothetical protein [Pseudobacteroides cellulosolvens]